VNLNRTQQISRVLICLKNWDFRFDPDSDAAAFIAVFDFIYGRKVLAKIYKKDYEKFLTWSTYLYDSFHHKNIQELLPALKAYQINGTGIYDGQ
jgi:hypothetical protein